MVRPHRRKRPTAYHDRGILERQPGADLRAAELRAAMNAPQDPAQQGWMDRLAKRWKVSPSRVVVILIVFACTGFTVLFLKRPVVAWFTGEGEQPLLFSVLYYILILPVYNAILLVYGFVFGQFRFFWEFEKRFFRRLTGRR